MIKLGNIEAYLNKHASCAHVRPWGAQKVGPKFYIKEHAKPLALFEKHKILTSTRLYFLSQYTIVSILNLKTWIKILARKAFVLNYVYLAPAKFEDDPMKAVGSIWDWSLKNGHFQEIGFEIRSRNGITHYHQPSTCDNFSQNQYFLMR